MIAFVILCAVLYGSSIVAIWVSTSMERRAVEPLAFRDPLPDVGASDEDFEAWARRALGIAQGGADRG